MTSYINPRVVPIPSPVGIDAALEQMRAALGGLPWIQTVYGRAIAQHAQGDRGLDTIFPEVWGVNREPENVMPNDHLDAYSFFVARDPGTFLAYQPLDNQIFQQQPISLIVWANLKKIDPNKDYRYSEELKIQLIKAMRKVNSFIFLQSYEGYSKVFEGFTITDTFRVYLKPPYWAIRIDGTINYNPLDENCGAGDFNNDFNKDFYK